MNALDPIMPNGKPLSQCTFDEVRKWGKRLAEIGQVADNFGAKSLGELLTLIRSSFQLGLQAETKPNGSGGTDEIELLDTQDSLNSCTRA
jgi:hypothetical protein